jgi:hypothetical protein
MFQQSVSLGGPNVDSIDQRSNFAVKATTTLLLLLLAPTAASILESDSQM